MAVINFDASQVAPLAPREAIPEGWYPAKIVKSEAKATKAQDGSYIEFTFEILPPNEHAGAQLFDNCNIQNKNPVAVEIGYRTLSSICHAVGVIQVQDTSVLHGRPLMIKVSYRPAGPGNNGQHYDASNEIKGYKAYEQGGAVAIQPATFTPPPANAQQPQAQPQPWQPPVGNQQPDPNAQPWMQPQGQPPVNPQYQQPPGQGYTPPPAQPPVQPQPWEQPQVPQNQAPQVQQPWQQPAGGQPPAPVANPGVDPNLPPWMQPPQ